MTKELWLNLPVRDLEKSKAFFATLGFRFNAQHGNSEHSAGLMIGNKNIVVMLFSEPAFKNFTRIDIADTSIGSEVLISIDAESREEVDGYAHKVRLAGGTVFGDPGGNEWMYGMLFADLDGHRWNVLYMDISKMPQ